MARYVDLSAVSSGCQKIDAAIDMYTTVKNYIDVATTYLDHNNLRFGGINSSLDEQLNILKTQINQAKDMNNGVTATILANAQNQYEEYQAWLKSIEEANKNRRR